MMFLLTFWTTIIIWWNKLPKKEKNASYNEKICMHDIAMCTGWPTMTTLCGHCYYNRRWYDQTDQKNSSIIFHFQQEKKMNSYDTIFYQDFFTWNLNINFCVLNDCFVVVVVVITIKK